MAAFGASGGRRLHASVNARRGDAAPAGVAAAKIALAAILLGAAAFGAWKLCAKLHAEWVAQCVVPDVKAPGVVTVNATPHIREELVRGLFHLTNGCNLALIDFEEKRIEAMKSQPLIKSLSVTKRLPASVEISVEERKPAARVNFRTERAKDANGRPIPMRNWDVADADGVVFGFSKKDSASLPVVKTGAAKGVPKGARLEGRALSALRFVEICAATPDLRLDEVDVSGKSYMTARFSSGRAGDGNIVKIDWDWVDDPADRGQPKLSLAVKNLMDVVNTSLTGAMCTYFISEGGRVSVSMQDKEPIR